MKTEYLHKVYSVIPYIFSLLCMVHYAGAQDIDAESLILKHSISCPEIALSTTELIPQYHQDNKTDTIHTLLQYWQERCGITEPLMRYKVLQQIQNREFNHDWLPSRLPDYLDDYKDAATTDDENAANYFFDFDAWEYHALHPGFNDFTRTLASSITGLPDLSPVEMYFLSFYTDDFDAAREILAGGLLDGTRLDSVFQLREAMQQVEIYDGGPLGKEVQLVEESGETQSQPGFQAGFSFGTWMPTGKLKQLGTHPQIGLMAGGNGRRTFFGIHIKMGFLHTPHPYQAKIGGEIYDTQNFLQLYAGAHAGIALLNNPQHALYLKAGMGYDGIDPRNHQEREEEISGMINALNVNTGIRYQRKFQENRFFSIMVRYNVVRYSNKGGTDLSGNVVTAGLGYGFYFY